jgi:uncharacterized damage-inducible protein DinB
MAPEVWLRGPIADIAPIFQPIAHALEQVRDDIRSLAPAVPTDVLWAERGAATAGFHVLHLAGALDRLLTYARGELLNDAQRAAARAETVPHPEMDGRALADHVSGAIDRALAQVRATDPTTALDARPVGRAGLPSTMLGLLFHAAEHATRHAGQFITTVKIAMADTDTH